MAKREILAGATDQTIDVFIADSSSTAGAGLAGLVYNSSGLLCYFRKGATGTATQLSLATQTVAGAHSDGGFKEIDATNMKGVYRLDLSDTIVSTAGMVTLYLYGATNMAPTVLEIEVVSVDKFDAVRMGLTALPNVATGNAGALLVAGTGTAALSVSGGVAQADAAKVGGQTASASGTVTFPAATLASTTNITSATGVDITKILGTAISTPATAGVLDVNAKAVNNVSTSGVTTVSAYVGNTGAAINGSTVNTNLDATITSRMASYTQPTGFLAATFPTTVASTTNITSATGVDVTAINGSTAAAARLALSAGVIIPATVDTVTNSHTPTTTEFDCDDITEATNDHYVGRVVIFTSGALIGQATSITDYTQVGGIGRFTVVAMTEAPANNDTLIII